MKLAVLARHCHGAMTGALAAIVFCHAPPRGKHLQIAKPNITRVTPGVVRNVSTVFHFDGTYDKIKTVNYIRTTNVL